MTAPAGWYPDTANPGITRYWDGARWQKELHWDGTAWIDPRQAPPAPPAATPAPATTPPPSAAAVDPTPPVRVESAPTAAPTPAHTLPAPAPVPGAPGAPAPFVPSVSAPIRANVPGRSNPSPNFWILMIGSVGVGISSLLPWVSVTGLGITVSGRPGTGGPAVLILFAAALVAIAWPTISSPILSKARRIGLLPIVGFLALAVITNASDLADLNNRYASSGSTFGGSVSVDPGVGFYLYTVCVIALVVGVVRVWIASKRSTSAS